MKFEWDLNKAESNLKKHGISFDEAKSIFYDLLSAKKRGQVFTFALSPKKRKGHSLCLTLQK